MCARVHCIQCVKSVLRLKRTVVSRVLGVTGSYTVILRWSVVVIMAFPQLHSQSFQSVLLVQPRHAFLNKRHHPEREGGR